MADELDNIHDFEAKDTANKIPFGWKILFWGLILFGVYYFVTYMPFISGWSQQKAYTDSLKP
jgi:uncharacterized membrane protein HdeD (DUF308 family)